MDGRWKEAESNAEYYVRTLPDGTVAWVGEHAAIGDSKPFVNVFFGRKVSGTEVRGELFDVPKGRTAGVFSNIRVSVGTTEHRFEDPVLGSRTLRRPVDDFPINNSHEWGCGFYDENPDSGDFSLTGVWRCNDGGTYYLRQVGNRVVWFGEHSSHGWANVFLGRVEGDRIRGRWVDVPKGSARRDGELELRLETVLSGALGRTRFSRVSATGGFGGSSWEKTDSLRLAFRLIDLRIVRNADVGGINAGGDEPYLLPMYVTVGGNEYRGGVLGLRDGRPRVVSPLLLHSWGMVGDWPKNNLTWQEDLVPGTVVPIPEFVAYSETELRTFPGLQPNSSSGRALASFIPGIIAMEEASSRNDDIRTGYRALLDAAPGRIHGAVTAAVTAGGPFTEEQNRALVEALRASFRGATLSSALSDFFGILGLADPDKAVGSDFTLYSFGMLRDAALAGGSIPIMMTFGAAPGGQWQVRGVIGASRAPKRDPMEVSELEVTLESGPDDKRAGSQVEISVELHDRTLPFSLVHAPGQTFAGLSRHTVRIPLSPPALGSPRALHLRWKRHGGDGLLLGPDDWDLRRVRVCSFDRAHRRRVLTVQPVNRTFRSNETLRIPLM